MNVNRRRRSPRVATRLLGIVLLPMLVLVATAGMNAAAVKERAEEAERIESALGEVEDQVRADLVVASFVWLHGSRAVGAHFGLSMAQTGDLLGIDLQDALAGVDRQYRALLRELGPASGLEQRVEETIAIVDRVDDISDKAPIESLAELVGQSDARTTASLAQLDVVLREADGVGGIRTIHAVVRESLDAMAALGRQLAWAGLLSASDAPAAREAMLREYRVFTANYDQAVAGLQRLSDDPVVGRWVGLEQGDALQENAETLAGIAAMTGADRPVQGVSLAEVLGKGVQRMTHFSDLAATGLATAGAEAKRLHAGLRRSLWLSTGVVSAVAALTLTLVMLMARSIDRPIRALASAAERVSTGDLDDVRLPGDGPPELRRVSRTLAEVVANLRTVESQVGSLAVGELDGDTLSQPVPGRLGDLLHASVGRLSQTMTEREELARRLEHEATHDGLTGLPNRAAARDALAAALERARRAGAPVAVLFLDLDGFKQVNDTHGHDIGDRVLQVTAERLGAAVRGGDLVARIGGDEFVIVAEPAGDALTMLELGQRLVEEVSAPITVGSIATRVGASVGVALALDGEVDPDVLLRDADLAAYRAKTSGRNRAELFDDRLRAEVARRLDVEHSLRQAIVDDELELHFQPVVNPAGVAHGVEALVRWHRPGVGLVPPGEFIPVAEGSDLIIDLGRWVLHNACEHLARWDHEHEFGHFSMGVNLSGRHLLSLTCVDDIREALAATGADPQRLIVEITETVLMADLPLVTEHLERIRALGVRIAIDDFGTGYTSLTHLRRLPVDVIKVDRSMVSADQPNDALVLKLLVDTVHSLGLRLVAEGVETEAQLERVETLGCDEIQGFLFSRPVPVPDLAAAVRSSARA